MSSTRDNRLRNQPALRSAAEALDALGVEWAAIGGRVANEYRDSPRLTLDYDFYVRSLAGLREALLERGFEITKEVTTDSTGSELQQVRARLGDERYDFNLADHEYQFEAIERANSNDGINTVEDVVIQKLLAWRERDRDDIESILATGMSIDFDYVRRWCKVFDEAGLEASKRLGNALQDAAD